MNDIWRKIIIIFLLAFAASLFSAFYVSQVVVYGYEYTPEEMVMIGKIVQHECPYESELGQRLVIDTIMNRVESEAFPNTVRDVLDQPGQYCDPKKYPPKDIYILIAQEAINRTDPNVLWYRTNKYHSYGTPILVEGSHYFSGR